MEIFYILGIPITFSIVVMFVGYFYASKKEVSKPLVKFTIEVINATLYFENGDSLLKKFTGTVSIKSDIVYNRVFNYYCHYKADGQLLDWLIENKSSGFIFIDDNTLIPIEKVTQIGLERSTEVIEVEGL
jgi:hypothetical protein